MPELPEVHNFKLYFDAAATGQTIAEVTVHDGQILRNLSGPAFADALTGRTILGSLRRGKYLFANLDNGHALLLHFGMTGDLNLYQEAADRGKFERFALRFTDGNVLGFDDPRKFARILYLHDRDAYIQEINLGPDALNLSLEDWLDAVKGRKATIKGLLLNQSILAGVGNLYADEICYRTRIHPAARACDLSEEQLTDIHAETIAVMKYGTENAPYYKDYPDDWFWHVWREEGKPGPGGVGEVKVTKVAGRTTYYVEGYQH
ncbi:formamidopyrimidine-DNA glycosylase [Lewinella marina]|uniref:DNA-(Apurinic or apyrimidinic site) lyase n=1 Tax=Neolewinella marina TaxID=438751 RepID=A0A2G0CFF3_9BACT|nr:DNA-formamidopyrimidine glycosylase family protein [Neolewinella marina]NJB85611.1 formamidopyrimidine-DNA glycosylase [Neolewinella marina]PHK98704.1 DNA-(apurinic or apyrimidinic site) lyase [Neolewinella marina]